MDRNNSIQNEIIMNKDFKLIEIKQTKKDAITHRIKVENDYKWIISNESEGIARISNGETNLKFHWKATSTTDAESPKYDFSVEFAEYWDDFAIGDERPDPAFQRVFREVANLCDWQEQVKSLINDLKYFTAR